MSSHCLKIVATVLALASTYSAAVSAQTCRVNTGVSPSGVKCYKEVFEYDYVTDKPTFPGGDSKLVEFINANRQYPADAYKKGLEGRVTCSFVVEADGKVTHIKVIRSASSSLNKEAVRVLKLMPVWNPGRINGVPVPVRVIRCVPFRR